MNKLCLLATVLGALSVQTAEIPDSPFPVQLGAVVPYEPTPFSSDGRQRIVYELLLLNFEGRAVEIQQLRILDADVANPKPLVEFGSNELSTMMQPIGRAKDQQAENTLPPGGSALVFVLLTMKSGERTPSHLRHELKTSAGSMVVQPISARHDVVQVLSAPLTGGSWLAETGLSNDNGHRRGYVVLNGRPITSRRYAFDWVKVVAGQTFAGDRQANSAYFGYGSAVIAVTDAVVTSTTDGIPENLPGKQPAVPMTFRNVPGNSVTLAIGHGYFAHYMHLQPGSLRVKAGDHVKRGQILGLVGNAGSSFLPHLHFEVTNSPIILGGEGVPYVFTSFKVSGATRAEHSKELPLEKMVVEFGS